MVKTSATIPTIPPSTMPSGVEPERLNSAAQLRGRTQNLHEISVRESQQKSPTISRSTMLRTIQQQHAERRSQGSRSSTKLGSTYTRGSCALSEEDSLEGVWDPSSKRTRPNKLTGRKTAQIAQTKWDYQHCGQKITLSEESEVTDPQCIFQPTEAERRNLRKMVASCPDGYFDDPRNYSHFKMYLKYALRPYRERYLVFNSTLKTEAWRLQKCCLEKGINLHAYEPGEQNTISSTIWAVNNYLRRKGPDMDDEIDQTMSKLPNMKRLARKIEGLKLEGRARVEPRPPQPYTAQQNEDEEFLSPPLVQAQKYPYAQGKEENVLPSHTEQQNAQRKEEGKSLPSYIYEQHKEMRAWKEAREKEFAIERASLQEYERALKEQAQIIAKQNKEMQGAKRSAHYKTLSRS